MTYGGTREWALWRQGGRREGGALVLYGRGYLYATEEAAQRGLDRLVKSGDVFLREGRASTALGQEVTVGRIR